MVGPAISRPVEAEHQHLWFCRAVEQHDWAAHGMTRSEVIGLVNRSPLILFSREKAERAMKFHRQRPPVLTQVRPQLVIDHMSGVLLMETLKQDDCLGVVALTIGQASEDNFEGVKLDGLSLTCGQLFLRQKGQSLEYEVAAQDVRSFVYEVQGKRLGQRLAVDTDTGRALAERDFRRGVITALEQLDYMRQPRQVVVEDRPAAGGRQRQSRTQDQVVGRSPDRPAVILLDPESVQVLRRQQHGGSHASPRPHHRRSHTRVLRHPRWGDKVGTVVAVREADVGVKPGEKIELPKRVYHVLSVGGATAGQE